MGNEILSIGEVLWDSMLAGLFLGGAPFNVAIHLHQLGVPVAFASRVGDDELGREIVRRMQERKLDVRLVQVDQVRATGFVIVALDAVGSPKFDIVHPSAWDTMQLTAELLACARECRAMVYGSLAQRDPQSRATIQHLWTLAPMKVFDVNLRPPFVDRTVVEDSLKAADIVKLNDSELLQLGEWFVMTGGMETMTAELAETFHCTAVCVTRGAEGGCLWHEGTWYEHPGSRVQVADAVGAGDAFLAALLTGLLSGTEPMEILERANALGAFVASHTGATPVHDPSAIEAIRHINAQ